MVANTTIHGVLMGYKIELRNKYGIENRTLNCSLGTTLAGLKRKSKYTVSLRGFTKYGDGKIQQYNFETLGM